MKKILLSLLIVMCVISCTSDESAIEGSIDRVGEEIRVTVHFYDDNRAIRQHYAAVNGISYRNTPANIQGFAVWHEWIEEPANVGHFCTIHTLRPKRIDDNNTLTLGHELLHCLYGTYHP
jgi:hypothetical protein